MNQHIIIGFFAGVLVGLGGYFSGGRQDYILSTVVTVIGALLLVYVLRVSRGISRN